MNNRHFKTLLCGGALLAAFPGGAEAVVLSGQSYARDVTASAAVTGSLSGVALANATVNVGPVNSAAGTSVAPYAPQGPYNVNASPLGVGASAGGGLNPLSLDAGVTTLQASASSNVDGGAGTRTTDATSRTTAATVDLGLNVLGLANADLLSIGVAPGSGGTASVFESSASLTGAGPGLTPSALTNFLATNPVITLGVLGVPVTVDTALFFTGLPFVVNISVLNVPVLNADVVGTVTFTPDFTSTSVVGNLHTVNATSLLVDVNLDVNVPGALPFLPDTVDLNVTSTIRINDAMASSLVAPVPEPSVGVIAAIGALCVTLGRRRTVTF